MSRLPSLAAMVRKDGLSSRSAEKTKTDRKSAINVSCPSPDTTTNHHLPNPLHSTPGPNQALELTPYMRHAGCSLRSSQPAAFQSWLIFGVRQIQKPSRKMKSFVVPPKLEVTDRVSFSEYISRLSPRFQVLRVHRPISLLQTTKLVSRQNACFGFRRSDKDILLPAVPSRL